MDHPAPVDEVSTLRRRSEMLQGYRTQITAAVGAFISILNAFFPDMIPPQVEQALVTLLVFLMGLFLALKVKNK